MKKAFITGIAGQDGSYLAELLLSHGYEVEGLVRSLDSDANIERIKNKLKLHVGDVADSKLLEKIVAEGNFDEVYNFASVATVADPFAEPLYLTNTTALPPLVLLEAIFQYSKQTKFFQASSAEMYGAASESPQSETTQFLPVNPYGVAKLFAHQMCELYRKRGVFAVSGILFNHESPRRGDGFVTKKIVRTLTDIKLGKAELLELGNLDSMRDWSFAGDFMEAAWQSLQADASASYVFASGSVHSVRDFVNAAALRLGMELAWSGTGVDECARDSAGVVRVKVNPQFFRPVETRVRAGDISKIKAVLGWQPKTSFAVLVGMMVDAELEKHAKEVS